MKERMNIALQDEVEPPFSHLAPWEGRAILLVDLDAFFASVEQLDHPAWRGKPVIVGGYADRHGVVSTCSYEARKFGVRSAMPASTAQRLCPDAIWTQGHFDRYREISNEIMSIIRDETPFVQQVSIDEAFADVTPGKASNEHPLSIATRIQNRVKELGITCSIGLGTSKTVAKIASDLDKPEGLTTVFPGTERQFLSPLPVRKMSGIGPSAEKILLTCNVRTLGELAKADPSLLRRAFGKNAEAMRGRALGLDESPIETEDDVKSVSHEVTFAQDLTDYTDIKAAIETIASKVGRRLRLKSLEGNTVAIKVKFEDGTSRTAQCKLERATADENRLFPHLHKLLEEIWAPGLKIRLLGVSVTNFKAEEIKQIGLFEDEENSLQLKHEKLIAATDLLKNKYGESSVRYGRELRNEGNTTGSAAKNPADYK